MAENRGTGWREREREKKVPYFSLLIPLIKPIIQMEMAAAKQCQVSHLKHAIDAI